MEQRTKKQLLLDFMKKLEEFSSNVNQLTQDSALPDQQEFLRRVASDVNELYANCVQVNKCQDEDAEEISGIIQSIFEQPLSIEKEKLVTIIKAAKDFSEGSADLSHIMREYVKHPETTLSFLRELQILTQEMGEILKKVA